MTLESQKLLWYFFLAMGKWVKFGKQYSLRHILAVNSTLCSACTGLIWGAKTALSACERWRAQLHCRVTVSNVMHFWKQTVPPVLEAHSARAQQSQQTFSWKKISQWNYLESWWLCIRLCCYELWSQLHSQHGMLYWPLTLRRHPTIFQSQQCILG